MQGDALPVRPQHDSADSETSLKPLSAQSQPAGPSMAVLSYFRATRRSYSPTMGVRFKRMIRRDTSRVTSGDLFLIASANHLLIESAYLSLQLHPYADQALGCR